MDDEIDIEVDLPQEVEPPKPVVAPKDVDGIPEESLIKMGNYLMQGMNETEAAILAGIDRLRLTIAKRTSDTYNNFVERKKLEFKAKHLNIIARKSDVKISQWLLERLAPDEFSSKGSKAPEVPTNAVAAIIKEIQQGGEETSSLAFAYKDIHAKGSQAQGASKREAEDRIRDVLS